LIVTAPRPRQNDSTVSGLQDLTGRVAAIEKNPAFTEAHEDGLIAIGAFTAAAIVLVVVMYILAFATKSIPAASSSSLPRSNSTSKLLQTTATDARNHDLSIEPGAPSSFSL
jgi:hypothetical protein